MSSEPTEYVQTSEAKAAYDARWRRVMDCVALKQPDRMPVAMWPTFWLAKYGGISYRELMYDYDKAKEIAERAVLEFEPDVHSPMVLMTASGRSLERPRFQAVAMAGSRGGRQPALSISRSRVYEAGGI